MGPVKLAVDAMHGLKAKNAVDIYEGYLVRFPST
jgi:hypothetical protein